MRKRITTYAAGGLVLIALAAAALLCIFFFNRIWPQHSETALQSASPFSAAALSSATSTLAPPPNTKAYQSDLYRFSLFYPDDLTVAQQPGADGSIVLLFQNASSGQGFDIFIAPYDQPKITQQTFEMDEPSDVMDDSVNITVDGAPATEFISTNQAMGASVEMWFLHDGFLYEVTAPQPLASWLLQIMGTWQFT
jgi:hypothetical protein